MTESKNQRMNRKIREGRSAPPVTVGGAPDEDSSSMKLTRWAQAENRRRTGIVNTEDVMTNVGDEG